MADEPRQSGAASLKRAGELVAWILMMIGGAFVPGLVIALCVVLGLAISHLVS